ncbi:MAG: KH domain-containing protein [Actinomycetota bacterium]
MKDLVEFLAKQIVDEPDAVRVSERTDDRGLLVSLNVAPDDMGKVIGKGGRTARAIRSVVRAAGTRQDIHASVEIVED